LFSEPSTGGMCDETMEWQTMVFEYLFAMTDVSRAEVAAAAPREGGANLMCRMRQVGVYLFH